MKNFEYYNPVRIIFGKKTIARLSNLVPRDQKVLVVYGGGSIKKNGIYEQVSMALSNHSWEEFSGIEPNPEFDTCVKAVEKVKSENITFLVAVGGGSVIDASKFIAAASMIDGDPWRLLTWKQKVKKALPLGVVLTVPGTASEMNSGSVISRRSMKEKRFFGSKHLFPLFSILDPETSFSLPEQQTANGIADAFIHVLEQYLTYPSDAPLQDRQAESILSTLIEEAPKVLKDPQDYAARANIMWCATGALNGLLSCGVPQDWSAHTLGHEMTALFGIDHARTLTIILPAVLKQQKKNKQEKLLQYAERIFNITGIDTEKVIDEAIARTVAFFESLGLETRLSDLGIGMADVLPIAESFGRIGLKIGERMTIGRDEMIEIFELAQ